MSRITLKHLRYFEAVARHRHFGRAAEGLSISQPAVSLQMKELEAILGAPLVERGSRQIRLTGLGEEVALRARDILRGVDEVSSLAQASSWPLSGRLRFGIIPTISPYLLPRLLQQLDQRFPDLSLRPREATTAKLVRDLAEGQLDLAMVALPVSEPWLAEYPLFDESFLLVRPAAEAAAPVPRVGELGQMTLLLLEEGHCFRNQAIAACKLPRTPKGEIMEGSSLSTLVQMVAAGLGVTLIPEMAAQLESRAASVTLQRLADPQPSRTVGLVWRQSNPLSDSYRALAQDLHFPLSAYPAA